MTTEQLSMLTAMMQNAARPNFGGSKDNKTDFQDMLAQKTDRPAESKDPVKQPAKDNVQQDKPQTADQNTAQGESEDSTSTEIMAAQQLAMALAAQQFTMPVAAPEQPVVETVPVAAVDLMQQSAQPEVLVQTDAQAAMPEMPEQQAEMPVPDEMVKQPTEQKTAQAPLQQAGQADTQAEPEIRVQTDAKQGDDAFVKQENTENKDQSVRVDTAQTEQPLFREIKSTPIKVGENMHTVDTEAPDMDSQLADKLQATLKQVGDKVEIQLRPEHLGKITIELTQTAGGIGLVVHAEKAKTTSLLSQHAANLGAMLEDRTGEQVQVHVPQQENQQNNYDGHNRQQHEQQQNHTQPEQMDKDEQDSFLGQLRLGLFQMENMQ